MVLRYFGIVPGYGVNTDEEVPFYQLDTAKLKSMPADGSSPEILEARYMNGVLYIDAVSYTHLDVYKRQLLGILSAYEDLKRSGGPESARLWFLNC